MSVAAVEAKDLVKVFDRGRRTIWQRVRREPDKRDRGVGDPDRVELSAWALGLRPR